MVGDGGGEEGGNGDRCFVSPPPGEEGAAGPGAAGASCPVVTRSPWKRRGWEVADRPGSGREAADGGVLAGSGFAPGLCRQASGRWG